MKSGIVMVLVAVMLAVGAGAQKNAGRAAGEQLEFSAEDEGVKAPVRIPDPIWEMLRTDAQVKSALGRRI